MNVLREAMAVDDLDPCGIYVGTTGGQVYASLRGTLRDPVTERRRAFIRFFACEEDLSHESPDYLLPEAVATGAEPLYVVGAMAGG